MICFLILIISSIFISVNSVGQAPKLVNVDGQTEDVIYLGPTPPLTVGETLTVTALAVDNDTYADDLEARLLWQRNNSDVVHNQSMVFSNPPAGVTGKWYYDLEINSPATYRLQVAVTDGTSWTYSAVRTVEWKADETATPGDNDGHGRAAGGVTMLLMFLSFMAVGSLLVMATMRWVVR